MAMHQMHCDAEFGMGADCLVNYSPLHAIKIFFQYTFFNIHNFN